MTSIVLGARCWTKAAFVTLLIALPGCNSLGLSTAVGPSRSDIRNASKKEAIDGIQVIDVTDAIARQMRNARERQGFAEIFGDVPPVGTVVGTGDVLDITIWEAPPAALYSTAVDSRTAGTLQGGRASTLPPLQVGPSGKISVPFAGLVPAAGLTLQQIEREIVSRLARKANQPQAIVRLAQNVTTMATVIGEVGSATRFSLTPKGERLLDALAAAGGTRQPANKITIQITRGGVVRSMPLRDVIRDPRQNISLKTDDVVTALFQPFSFTVLGATGRNAEIEFEETGLTLAQAMGRIGGLQDARADPKGVFIFRWEDPVYLQDILSSRSTADSSGRVPVIYRIDMRSPATYFAAQNFEMRDKDVVFVTNSPFAEFQRFMSILSSTILPVATVDTILKSN